MLTLGIDLSADDRRTATCLIEWSGGRSRVEPPEAGHSNEALVDRIRLADRTGIDAPFGWPDRFVSAVGRYAEGGGFPTEVDRDPLRFRTTDLWIKERGRLPLSVSSDRIAVTAMRCAALLTQLGESGEQVDRTGVSGRVVEVYPAAALTRWGFDIKGYKDKRATEVRGRLVAAVEAACEPWLNLPEAARDAFVRSDDHFDAFVSSLIARAASIGATTAPGEHREVAAREGWIHLPDADALSRLAAD